MKKVILTGLGLALLLVSCGGSSNKTVPPTPVPNPAPTPTPTPNPTPTPTPTPTQNTLYRGVWGWAIGNPTTEKIIDSGAVAYTDQTNESGRIIAGGVYINESQSRKGISLLGPISKAGKLETGFTADMNDGNKLYFVGIDDNGVMEDYKGMPSFAGAGALFDSKNQPSQQVIVVLVQTSTTIPTGSAALNSTKAQAKTQALQALKSMSFSNAQRINTAELKAIAQFVQK